MHPWIVKTQGDVRREFSQLVTDHILRYRDIIVLLSIVDLEPEPDEIRKDRSRARLRLDWGLSFTGPHSCNGEAVGRLVRRSQHVHRLSYGTMLGPTGSVSIRRSRQNHADPPFQTDRAHSALVGNIVMYTAELRSAIVFDFSAALQSRARESAERTSVGGSASRAALNDCDYMAAFCQPPQKPPSEPPLWSGTFSAAPSIVQYYQVDHSSNNAATSAGHAAR